MSIIPHIFGRRSNVFDPFALEASDPFEGWPFNNFRSLSDQFRTGMSSETASFAHANIDWKETPKAHVFKADVPGLKKGEVKVEVEDGRVLQISGERSREREEKNDTWHRVERSSGKFMRRFRLPENAKVDHVKAAMEDGVLTVTVPKAEEKKLDVKSIDISESAIPVMFSHQSFNDLFSCEIWDLFKNCPQSSIPGIRASTTETSASTTASSLAAQQHVVDWEETPKAYIFKANMSGMKNGGEVKVGFEDGRILQISGEVNQKHKDKNHTLCCEEWKSEKFVWRFRLPENVKVDEAKAVMENGVLVVTLPKVKVELKDESINNCGLTRKCVFFHGGP